MWVWGWSSITNAFDRSTLWPPENTCCVAETFDLSLIDLASVSAKLSRFSFLSYSVTDIVGFQSFVEVPPSPSLGCISGRQAAY